MKRARIGLLFILLLFPTLSYGAELNAGFVRGLWYAPSPVVHGKETRIYVALRNNTDGDLTGTVRFTDNNALIGTKAVSALPGRIVEAWIDWTPTYGEHTIAARLTGVKVSNAGTTTQGEVSDTLAEEIIIVDYDTDSDGIPNEKDTDDDNDSVSDTEEKEAGTDPLVSNPKEEESPNTEEDDTESAPTNTTNTSHSNSSSKSRDEGGSVKGIATHAGLETYLPEGVLQTAANSVTERIEETKRDLDTYRQKRSDELAPYFNKGGNVSKSTTATDTGSGVATITRTKASDSSFIDAVLEGGRALIAGFYTFFLWVASNALAHPAVVELILLLVIIYIIYRTARSLGRRHMSN